MKISTTRLTLAVSNSVLLSYVSQISHVPSATVANWSLHEWAGSLILVVIAGVTTWSHLLEDPSAPKNS